MFAVHRASWHASRAGLYIVGQIIVLYVKDGDPWHASRAGLYIVGRSGSVQFSVMYSGGTQVVPAFILLAGRQDYSRDWVHGGTQVVPAFILLAADDPRRC